MNQQQYQQLASQFIDMWQQQMQTVMTDKDFLQAMFAGLQQWSNVANSETYGHTSPNTTASTAATRADEFVSQLGQLDYRLRMVEARLSKLEAGAKPRAGTKPAAAKRRSTGKKPPR